ncbi:hypothetical protein CDAR_280791 [Caerostris darwini]|uniref:Fibronectin type-III domain-containing protein n=1 Tax=Caerostris darwini TaxID=1538125 RepID=A0AAV4MI90_9ARAC|nr:hypothetical protein CDAR_280791 [Caerostris darwini]
MNEIRIPVSHFIQNRSHNGDLDGMCSISHRPTKEERLSIKSSKKINLFATSTFFDMMKKGKEVKIVIGGLLVNAADKLHKKLSGYFKNGKLNNITKGSDNMKGLQYHANMEETNTVTNDVQSNKKNETNGKENEIQAASLNNSSIPRFLKRFLFEYPTEEEVKPQEDKQESEPKIETRSDKKRKFRKLRRQHSYKIVNEEKKEEQLGRLPDILQNKQTFHQTENALALDNEQFQREKPAYYRPEQPLGPVNLSVQILDNRCAYLKWRQPRNALKSQIRGYLVETWLESEQRWVEVKGTPITRPATKLCDLSEQYNVMRIRAYNDFGIGKPSRQIDLNKSYQQQVVRPKFYHRTMENETRLTALANMSASPLNYHSGRG